MNSDGFNNSSSSSGSASLSPQSSDQVPKSELSSSAMGPSSSSSASNSPPPTPPLRTRNCGIVSSTYAGDDLNGCATKNNSLVNPGEELTSSLSDVTQETDVNDFAIESSESSSSSLPSSSSSATSLSEGQVPTYGCDENGHETQENDVDNSQSDLSLLQSIVNDEQEGSDSSSSTWSLNPGDEAVAVDENNSNSGQYSSRNDANSENGEENNDEDENEPFSMRNATNDSTVTDDITDTNGNDSGTRQDSLDSHDSIQSDSPTLDDSQNLASTSQATESYLNDDPLQTGPSQSESVQNSKVLSKHRNPTRSLHRRAYSTAGVFKRKILCHL